MIFIDGQREVLARLKKSTTDTEEVKKVKTFINDAYKEIGNSYLWRHLERYAEIPLVEAVDGGTISVSTGSRTVTGLGTSFSSSMIGRFVSCSAMTNPYRILSVESGTSLTLETPLQEDSASGITYSIFKKFYRINTDVRIVLPDEQSNDMNSPFSIHGCDRDISAVTGTFSVTKDSSTLTGTGTSFLGNVYPGDLITLGVNYFRVEKVLSDTSIRMLNKSTITVSDSGTISSVSPLTAVFDSLPTANQIYGFQYVKKVYPMVNDSDVTELPEDFDLPIKDLAFAEYLRTSNSSDWLNNMQIAMGRISDLKGNSLMVIKPYHQMKCYIPRGNGRG